MLDNNRYLFVNNIPNSQINLRNDNEITADNCDCTLVENQDCLISSMNDNVVIAGDNDCVIVENDDCSVSGDGFTAQCKTNNNPNVDNIPQLNPTVTTYDNATLKIMSWNIQGIGKKLRLMQLGN